MSLLIYLFYYKKTHNDALTPIKCWLFTCRRNVKFISKFFEIALPLNEKLICK